jgi:hypothetical protein
VGKKFGYLGVLQDRKNIVNVPHSFEDGCLWIFGSHIYGCGRIYLKNEAIFGLDRGWELFILEGMDLRTGIWGDELLNFLDFWRGED